MIKPIPALENLKERGCSLQIEGVCLIVLDGVGVGALPDAYLYGDEGSNTLLHIDQKVGGLKLPHLEALGLGNILSLKGVSTVPVPEASYGKMAEKSKGKDSTTGHWEIAGLILSKPFPVYPEGFPEEIIREFIGRTGYGVLGNKVASGTEIIQELGEEHLKTKKVIVYTSADSVFQIAAHQDILSLDELYRICRIAREILDGEHAVARVIARPFRGSPGNFTRTADRRDFSLPPPEPTLLDKLTEKGLDVVAIGKVKDIFAGRGLTQNKPAGDNQQGLQLTLEALYQTKSGLIFTNLGDFDTKFGHRNDVYGFARALKEFDDFLPAIVAALPKNWVLAITADHGCDPTTPSTDHSREYVPLLIFLQGQKGKDLGTRASFCDLGTTVSFWLRGDVLQNGKVMDIF